MIKFIRYINCVLFFFICGNIAAQENINNAYFTSEAATAALGENIIVSIKKYNATEEQIKTAGHYDKNTPMTYLQLPFFATQGELFEKEFESVIVCFDKTGTVLWNTTIGYSKNSLPSPIAVTQDFLYTGESLKEEAKVVIQKIDRKGKLAWKTNLDSLENLNSIYVFNNRVNALVSFNHSERVDDPATKTFKYNSFPVYFFVQLNIENGQVIKKEMQQAATYLSSHHFGNPVINSDYSYYMSSADTAVYLTIMNQKTYLHIINDVTPQRKILGMTADSGSIHLLGVSGDQKNRNQMTIYSNYYDQNKNKYSSELPFQYYESAFFRSCFLKTNSDSILSVGNDSKNIYLSFTDRHGKSALYKKIENPNKYLPIAIGILYNIPYIITVEGRTKPGETGKIKIIF